MIDKNEPIHVPHKLLLALENEFPNRRTIENHLLFWHFVDCWPYIDETKDNWRQINDENFGAVVSTQNYRGDIRKWLEHKGFLEIKKYLRWDGELVNHYIPGEESCKYKPLCHGELKAYWTECKPSWDYFKTYTENELLCKATRANLALLRQIPGENPKYANKKAEKRKKNRGVSSLKKLRANAGVVKRGHQVRRIFSPWVTCNREVRKCFLLGGCGIAAIDLKAAHPTLISQMSGDQKLARDCQSDTLYHEIAHKIGQSRDDAKKAFMAYAYGNNRKDGRGNKEAFLVQEWMKANYPTAASFVKHQKTVREYEQFSIDLQNLEASIFVDGAFRELCEIGMPALTVHDAIYFRDHDFAQVKYIINKHMDNNIENRQYTIEEEEISRPPRRTPPYVHQVSELDSEVNEGLYERAGAHS